MHKSHFLCLYYLIMLVKTTLDSEYTVGNTVCQLPEHICEDVKTSTDETEPVTLICIEWICKVQLKGNNFKKGLEE